MSCIYSSLHRVNETASREVLPAPAEQVHRALLGTPGLGSRSHESCCARFLFIWAEHCRRGMVFPHEYGPADTAVVALNKNGFVRFFGLVVSS